MLSNRMSFIAREHLRGQIVGVDFGNSLACIARSASAALLWSGGTSYWSSRGCSSYGTSTLYALTRAEMNWGRGYRRLGTEGGRLTVGRLAAVIADIEGLFGEIDLLPWLTHAIVNKQTLLIEGGGERFQPSTQARHGGVQAHKQWLDELREKHR
jgi:hypothetical protein